MEKTGAVLVLLVFAVLLISWSDAIAATDGFYWLYESAPSWDGTDANRTKAPTADYDYTYGDEDGLTFTLPWPLTFYGQSYSQIHADTNGNVWFAADGFAHSINLSSTGRGPVIAAWNDDLSSYYYGGVFVQHKTDPERVVIEWHTETYSDEGGYAPNNLEAVLYPSGNMRLDYRSFSGSQVKDFGSGISRGDGISLLNLSSAFGNVYTLAGRSFKIAKVTDLLVSIDRITSPVKVNSWTLSGTMTGTEVSIAADSKANFSEVTYPTATTWNCTASGLAEGPNVITAVTKDEAGNTGSAKTELTVDTIAPTVSISTPIAAISNSRLLTLAYTVSDGAVIVKLDGAAMPIANNATLPALADGSHILVVEAADLAGNVGRASVTFIVDTVAPDANIIAYPATMSDQKSGSISFRSSDAGASFECKLDSASFASCTTPYAYANLVDGSHNFSVWAKDPAGNVTATPATIGWTIDTVPPVSSVIPAGGTYNSAQRVTVSARETCVIYYTTDGSQPTTASARYTAPISITDSCTLKFFAVDAAGNREVVKSVAYTVTGRVTLIFTSAGTGSGTVTCAPGDIACNTGCSARFDIGARVTLTAINSEYSIFKGWGGDCSGTAQCCLIMDRDKAVSATFDKDTAHSVRLDTAPISYYPSLFSAYLAAPASATIEAFGTEFLERLVFNQRKVVTIKGGYDGEYASDTGVTRIKGNMIIRQGMIRVNKVAVH